MRRIVRILIGVLATVTLSIGALLQSVLPYVSSADATAETVKSVISERALRDLIAREIVEKVEEENSDSTQRLLFVIARQRLVQIVTEKLEDPVVSDVVADIVRGAYRVYVDGENVVAIDLTRFSVFAEDAIAQIDNRLSTNFSDSFQTFEIERPRDSQKLGQFLTIAQIAAWVLLLIGIALLIVLWRIGDQSRHSQLRHIAVVIGATGFVLGGFVLLARKVTPGVSEEYGDVVSVLTDFVTRPVWAMAIAGVVVALIVGGVSMQLARRHMPH